MVRSIVFDDNHDCMVNGSTPTQASLRPWIRYFMIIISAWWSLTSIKLKKLGVKTQPENLETNATPKQV